MVPLNETFSIKWRLSGAHKSKCHFNKNCFYLSPFLESQQESGCIAVSIWVFYCFFLVYFQGFFSYDYSESLKGKWYRLERNCSIEDGYDECWQEHICNLCQFENGFCGSRIQITLNELWKLALRHHRLSNRNGSCNLENFTLQY